MICLHFHLNTGTPSDVYTHTVICRHTGTCAHIHIVNLITDSQVHSVTVMHMYVYDHHSHIHTCIDSEIDVHINKLTQIIMVPHSLRGKHATIMHMLTNSLKNVNTQKHTKAH